MKLASGLLLYQRLTQCWPRFDHERDALRSPLLDARLHARRADGDDDQHSSRHPAARRAEPSQRIETAAPLHAEVLESGRWAHDHPDQVVDDGQHGQVLQHAWYRFTVPYIHRHRGLELRQCGFDLPALAGPLGTVGHTVTFRVEERGHQGDLAGPEARAADVVASLAAYS